MIGLIALLDGFLIGLCAFMFLANYIAARMSGDVWRYFHYVTMAEVWLAALIVIVVLK